MKLTLPQVWFLLVHKLIDPVLVQNWKGIDGPDKYNQILTEIAKAIKSERITNLFLSVLFTISAYSLVLVVFMRDAEAPSYTRWKLLLSIGIIGLVAYVILILLAIHPSLQSTGHKFTKSLQHLCNQGIEIWCLTKSTSHLAQFAETKLSIAGCVLRKNELRYGVDHPETVNARCIFKEMHSDFYEFGLCLKNQGEYISDLKKQLEATT